MQARWEAYRPDIDGLRAIAVSVVVLFHANVALFSGGFVGVDIFFVISGYLITNHLRAELAQKGRIDFAAFYARRMRRLLPALLLVIFATVTLRLFFVPGTSNPKKFASSIAAGLLGFANIFFKRNTGGYFDGANDEMPLLHLWSLGVEEQFYLAWPLLLGTAYVLARRFAERRSASVLAGTVVVLSAVSLFAAERKLGAGQASSAFFLVPFRAWELGVGALVAFLPAAPITPKFFTKGLGWLGLLMLVSSIFLFSGATKFPGLSALLPTLGAALLIYGGKEREGAAHFLSCKPFVRIGLVSYGWYLWHWPLLAFAKTWNYGQPPAPLARLALVGASLALGFASLYLVERPLRFAPFWNRLSPRRTVLGGLAGLAALAALSFLVPAFDNYSFQAFAGKKAVSAIREELYFKNCDGRDKFALPACEYQALAPQAEKAAAAVAVWGDSQACAFAPMAEEFARQKNLKVYRFCEGRVPPLLTTDALAIGSDVIALLAQKTRADPARKISALLVARWPFYLSDKTLAGDAAATLDPTLAPSARAERLRERFAYTLGQLTRAGVYRVLVTLPSPEIPKSAPICLRRDSRLCATSRRELAAYDRPAVAALRAAAQPYPNVHFIDPQAALCNEEQCELLKDGVPILWDMNHVTAEAARAVGRYHARELDWLVGN